MKVTFRMSEAVLDLCVSLHNTPFLIGICKGGKYRSFVIMICVWSSSLQQLYMTYNNKYVHRVVLPPFSHSSSAEPCSWTTWKVWTYILKCYRLFKYIRDLDHTFLQLKLTWALAGKFRFRAATCQTFAMRRMTYIIFNDCHCLPNNHCFSWDNQPFWPHWQVTSNEGHYRSI